MVLVIVALMGQARAQETSELSAQLDAYVMQTLPWLVYSYHIIIPTPVSVERTEPPWLILGGSQPAVFGALPPARVTVSPIRPDDN